MHCTNCGAFCTEREQDLVSDLPLSLHGTFCVYCCVQLGWANPALIDDLEYDFEEPEDDEDS
jgi:Fe-S-cluster containining protein